MTSKFAQLVYGPAGSGKTDYCLSAMWDVKTKAFKRPGLYITFGKEGNVAFDSIPVVTTEDIKAGKPGRIRLSSPRMDDIKFADTFKAICTEIYRQAQAAKKAGKSPAYEVIVVDGITEFGMLYEQVFRAVNPSAEKWAVWNTLLSYCISVMQLLDAEELGAYVLVTARVSEKRRGITDRQGNTVGADPDFMTSDNVPYMNGQFRDQLPHYFSMVNYIKTEVKAVKEGASGQDVRPVHSIRMVATDSDFLVKNQWEREWLAAKKPRELPNADFDNVIKIIEEITSV